MFYAPILGAALGLARVATPSLTDPFAIIVLAGGLGMAVAMFLAGISIRPDPRQTVHLPPDELLDELPDDQAVAEIADLSVADRQI